MKLVMAIINSDDEKDVSSSIMKSGFSVTKIGSTGGFLRKKLTTLVSAVCDDKVSDVLQIIKNTTHVKKYKTDTTVMQSSQEPSKLASEIIVGGATVFVLGIEENYKF